MVMCDNINLIELDTYPFHS